MSFLFGSLYSITFFYNKKKKEFVVPDYTVWCRDYPPIRELYECRLAIDTYIMVAFKKKIKGKIAH